MKILAEWINCGACEPECPNQAITADVALFVIDVDRCTECVGAYATPQCVEVCPVDCIVYDLDHVESPEELKAKFDRLHV